MLLHLLLYLRLSLSHSLMMWSLPGMLTLLVSLMLRVSLLMLWKRWSWKNK
jgi:hypothetical protein